MDHCGALAEDLDRFNVDQGCVNVDIMIEQYDKYLSDLLDKHAPNNNIYIYVVERPLSEWMTDDIHYQACLLSKNIYYYKVISVPIKDCIHHYPRALFNNIPRVGAYFYDIPESGRTFTT